MVDGEGHARRGRDIGRICDFLKIGADRDCQRKEQVINHIECGGDPCVFHESIGSEHQEQPRVLEQQGVPLADTPDKTPDSRDQEHIYGGIDEEQRTDGGDIEPELFHHQKAGKHDEDLPSRTRHEFGRVEQPVTPAQDDFLVLLVSLGELRIGERRDENDQQRQVAAKHVDPLEVEISEVERNPDQTECDY